MPAWLALVCMALSAAVAAQSLAAAKKARRTGEARAWYYPFGIWAERSRDPRSFKRAVARLEFRMAFFILVTIVLGAYFLEALGVVG